MYDRKEEQRCLIVMGREEKNADETPALVHRIEHASLRAACMLAAPTTIAVSAAAVADPLRQLKMTPS